MRSFLLSLLCLIVVASGLKTKLVAKEVKHCVGECQQGAKSALMTVVMKLILEARAECKGESKCPLNLNSITGLKAPISCTNGFAQDYPCSNVDLGSFVSLTDLGSSSTADGNDIWGWKDEQTGRLYALTGQTDGSSYVDVTDPLNPFVLGFLPSNVKPEILWRDVKVYKNHAFVVADDYLNAHGLQVLDLTQFRKMKKNKNESFSPTSLKPDALYTEFGSCHNIFINEDSGFLYAVGTKTCSGGLHVVNIQDPIHPTFAGCFSSDGYTHDLECVNYHGPDENYKGHEICFNYNENTLTIVDVTDKDNMKMVSRTGYKGASYTHQGFLRADHQYLLADDELDEVYGQNNGHTVTYIWDVRSLSNPVNIGDFHSPAVSVDHNLYIKGNYCYATNYQAGLRIMSIENIADGKLHEVAYFDVYPEGDGLTFLGSWSNYPFFDNGYVIVQSIDRGLFILKPNLS